MIKVMMRKIILEKNHREIKEKAKDLRE